MEETTVEVLVKSEKISQKKKIRLVWAISILLIIVTMVSFIIDYSGYRKGQQYGLASVIVATGWANQNDSYAEQCRDVYSKLRYYSSYSYRINSTLTNIMQSAGYDRYYSYDIEDWFKYTDFAEYFSGYYGTTILPICCYIIIIISLVFTILVNREAKKELVVYEDSVLCRVNPKISKQLVFEDISNVSIERNALKLVGIGVKFKISNITNAETIKSVIIEKKKSEKIKSNSTTASSVDELKKYKELLDGDVISQEEFDKKKNQLLDL